MQKLQSQGVHHITLGGADRQSGAATDNIDQGHLADAIETLVRRSRPSHSDDRSPKHPYD